MRFINYILNNMESVYLFLILLISLMPFLEVKIFHQLQYMFSGFLLSSMSLFVLYFCKSDNEKITNTFNKLGIAMIVFGIISFISIKDKNITLFSSAQDLCYSTYIGALSGLIISGLLFGFVRKK